MEINGGSGSYYDILGVSLGSSDDEIRRAYKKLAMQWHPDKWTRTPVLLSEAKGKFQQIQEAYSVLSDGRKRAMYDAGLYDPEDDEDEVEGFADFLQEMVSLVEDVKREGKSYSMEDLRSMFWEMARSFESPDWCSFPENPVCEPPWLCGPSTFHDSGTSGSAARDPNLLERNLHLHFPGLEMHATSHVCRLTTRR